MVPSVAVPVPPGPPVLSEDQFPEPNTARSIVRLHVLLLLAAAALSGITGQVLAFGHAAPADVLSLGGYALLFAALLCVPAQPIPRAVRTRIFIDALMVIAAIGAFSWYFALGRLWPEDGRIAPAVVVRMAYPVTDLALLFGVLMLFGQLRTATVRRVTLVLALAVACLVASDTTYYYQTLQGIASPLWLLYAGRATGFVVAVFAILATRVTERRPAHADPVSALQATVLARRMPSVWRYLVPYALIPAVVGLIVYVAHSPMDHRLEPGVYLISAILLELVFVHQFLAYRELISYSSKNARLESLAGADPITGLPNHRSIMASLTQELEHSRETERSLAVLFLDLDHFKALNDTYGHRLGDAALREFASVARVELRATDVLGRWGGEEFVALLPDTDMEVGCMVAERIRSTVAAQTFRSIGGGHVTCSIGVAAHPRHARDRDELVERADQAMYAAKRRGRNRICTSDDVSEEEIPPASRDEAAVRGIVEALASIVEVRDPGKDKRAREVATLGSLVAGTMGLDAGKRRMIELAARLLDIGTISVGGALTKSAPLAEEEWERMRSHPVTGASTVSRVPALRPLAPLIRAHHECWDGTGYPDGLAGEKIPLGARILAVVDAYVAMTSDRPFRAACSREEAMAEVRRCAGTQFDPAAVTALETATQMSPRGSAHQS